MEHWSDMHFVICEIVNLGWVGDSLLSVLQWVMSYSNPTAGSAFHSAEKDRKEEIVCVQVWKVFFFYVYLKVLHILQRIKIYS